MFAPVIDKKEIKQYKTIQKMKKLLITLLAFTAVNSYAQKLGNFVQDDFATSTEYGDSTGGVFWFGTEPDVKKGPSPITSMVRGSGKLVVSGTDIADFRPFGFGFGDSNGAAAGGTPFSKNFGSNMNIKFTVKNNVSTDSIWFTFKFEDADGGEAEFRPDTGAVDWSNQKKKIGALVLPSETKTISLDVSSYGNIGGLKAVNYSCGSPNACPLTTYTLNPAKITKVLFFVNGAALLKYADRGEYKDFSPYTGSFEISNFQMGAVPTGINEAAATANTSIYPNPTSDFVNIALDLKESADVKVTVTDIFGSVVKEVAQGKFMAINQQVSVADLAKGVYTVNYIVNGAPSKSKLLLVK